MSVGILLLSVGLSGAARAGAWTREAGSAYLKLSGETYVGQDFVDPLTDLETDLRYRAWQAGFYGELGVLPAWPLQVTLQAPLVAGTLTFPDTRLGVSGEAHASSTRLGDSHVAVQTALLRKGFQLAVAVDAKIPLYDSDGIGVDYPGYRSYFPRPGDGQVDLEGALLGGASVPNSRTWFEGRVGWRHRTEWWIAWNPGDYRLVDGVTFRASGGSVVGHFGAQLGVDGIVNPKADDISREVISVGPNAWYELGEGFSIEARGGIDVWAVNTSRGYSAGLGVSWKRDGG